MILNLEYLTSLHCDSFFFDSFTIPNTNVFELERPKNESMYVVHVGNYIINQIGQGVFYNNN